ncbi:MAG: indolepyruvate ferredoxin oxidoreductase family protein [Alphaproteobacteria bacterium]|jgi:indolepyruvate ferredoxin oxidoreductase|nr:indolepyruvate ferredoxin oxidoreductase family protein [Alphaproteobacteria bacterium]MBT4018339.1 indolepyruvate ferredoxin oxidoreductase family protein [Alphaproteobacteria bacterium]MBT4966841.1 indolepyruvate ferredoxin oxidoreductase family protein [Alphaproteobacteria bacterium]MBT5160713.1 indolepyruvate ferredoxin oxidoreductase family protein [Alphaproteobacteria bacterium]
MPTDVMLKDVKLDDKYTIEKGRIFISGTQALVRLLMLQRQRDALNGLNTAAYISGYRGSPLGNVDMEIWRSKKLVTENHITFNPGLNEDLAATAVWGSQQVNVNPGAKYDGVFGMWYGKHPGVDRSGDAFRHGNHFGTDPKGGVLAIAGDDPACKSSSIPGQTELSFMDQQIPVLAPTNVQEFLDYGAYGYDLSRYSGCWVAMKVVTENVESTVSAIVDPERIKTTPPANHVLPEGGLGPRWPDSALEQEARLRNQKIPAIMAFMKANRLDKVALNAANAKIGIVSSGKPFADVMQALDMLGIDEDTAAAIGVKVYKVGMIWPLEPTGLKEFAEGLDEIFVIEEKRAFLEPQIKEMLFNQRDKFKAVVVGKTDENGEVLIPETGETSPQLIARALARRLDLYLDRNREEIHEDIHNKLALIDARDRGSNQPSSGVVRMPYFCSGCPHNSSTKVPDGSRAAAGIGCHTMAVWMNRSTGAYTQMGGEGATWMGQAPFTTEKHIFQNLGDGTYFHSGYLAIRAAVAAKTQITYKILFNNAVAMTGGQSHDGDLTPEAISKQVAAEGVKRIAVVSDGAEYVAPPSDYASIATFHHRSDLDAVQRELREFEDVSVLLYVQTCAAEKRRLRKRNEFPDPNRRVFINDEVCEGCGDCGIKANCVSIMPKETDLGRKRRIDQSACNKDFSCVDGFCPSFVTVVNGKPRKKLGNSSQTNEIDIPELPLPTLPGLDTPHGIIVAGIGGTGVVTIGAILGMAAHLEGKGVSTFDLTGLAQKNGPVICQVKVANTPEEIHTTSIAIGEAKTVIGCDIVTTGNAESLSKMQSAQTHAVVNTFETMPAAFALDKNLQFPSVQLRDAITSATGGNASFVNASEIATNIMGDAIASNLFMAGFAFQQGLLPISAQAINKAIELNGVRIEFNQRAFALGRWAAADQNAVEKLAFPEAPIQLKTEEKTDLEALIKDRVERLTNWQNVAWANSYQTFVADVAKAEAALPGSVGSLSEAVARNLFKLMAYKDEYEVARLYTAPEFKEKLKAQFEDGYSLRFHLAPPLIAKKDPNSGEARKSEYGAWVMSLFGILSKLKGLRGTALDIFGYSEERKSERALIVEYQSTLKDLASRMTGDTLELAIEVANLPEQIQGFGHVKERNLKSVTERRKSLLDAFNSGNKQSAAAE